MRDALAYIVLMALCVVIAAVVLLVAIAGWVT